jgi:hypothetical protein
MSERMTVTRRTLMNTAAAKLPWSAQGRPNARPACSANRAGIVLMRAVAAWPRPLVLLPAPSTPRLRGRFFVRRCLCAW